MNNPGLSSPIMVGIVEQPGAKLDLRDIMDAGKILIVNLSKGRVGEDNAALLGAFFVNGMQQAAIWRFAFVTRRVSEDRTHCLAYASG